MNSLYQKREKAFPSTVEIGGNAYHINAGFRNILRIFAMLRDGDIPEQKRTERLIRWFFADETEIDYISENISFNDIIQAFVRFVNPPTESEPESFSNIYIDDNEREKRFDYDFDADEIYASFLSEYSIDLADVEFLHWYKFKILLGSLSGESAFKKKIELRFMDLSHFTGQARADMERAKASVQLPVEYTDEELRERDEFENLWGNL